MESLYRFIPDTAELKEAINSLAVFFPSLREEGSFPVRFEQIGKEDIGGQRGVSVRKEAEKAIVRYTDLSCALRGVGTLLAAVEKDNFEITESCPFKTVGIMLDCSRNAVMRPSHFKLWLARLALLGYNMAMLYTEDTYELPDEPYFGYHRGRYTASELKDMDDYAASLGIEMIGCIQTLGHLEQILRWSEYRDIMDSPSVLLVGEQKTYELIDKMISLFAEVYRSRRIHIGMDEAHDLGRGRYLDLYGYRPAFDLFNEHLSRVLEICRSKGLSCMIWSDMYFRLGSKNMAYYDEDCCIPEDVKAKIPKDVELVYWDYYHTDRSEYEDMIAKHLDLGFKPIMASGVWTWGRPWYSRQITEATIIPCIEACKSREISEIFFTLWGDDGGYCVFDSAFAGLCFAAEKIFNNLADKAFMERRFAAITGRDYNLYVAPSNLDFFESEDKGFDSLQITAAAVLWDDPLYGIYYHNIKLKDADLWEKVREHYLKLSQMLFSIRSDDYISHAQLLAELFAQKVALRGELEEAYAQKDKKHLSRLDGKIDNIIALYKAVDRSFRNIWLKVNKPQGLDTIQRRLSSLIRRYEELKDRIDDYVAGRIDRIDELEDLPARPLEGGFHNYRSVISGSLIQ